MPERWQTEVRKLRTLTPPETVPSPRRHERTVAGPSMRHRAVALVVSFAVFAGAGYFVWHAFAVGHRRSPATERSIMADVPQLPTVGRIRCTDRATRVETPVIEAQADGIHLLVDDVSGGKWLVLRSPRDASKSSYRLEEGQQRRIRAFSSPGLGLVSCAAGAKRVGRRASFERIKVADPQGVWGDPRLSCHQRDATRFDVHGYTGTYPHQTTAAEVRQNLPSLRPSDDVQRAGYPRVDMWKIGRWFVVVRNGQTIATVTFWQVDGATTIYACPGSGITRPGHPWNET
jgi:hypothetical protein